MLMPLLCLFGGGAAYSQVTFVFPDSTYKHIQVLFEDSLYTLSLTENHAVISLSGKPGYAVVYSKHRADNVFVVPGEPLRMVMDKDRHWTFLGAGKCVNEYLQSEFLKTLSLPYEEQEEDFLHHWDSLRRVLPVFLEHCQLPDSFVVKEKQRLHYVACNMLLDYPMRHSRIVGSTYVPTASYYRCLKSEMRESDIDCWEYRQSFSKWIEQVCAGRRRTNNQLDDFENRLQYVGDSITDLRLKDYLVHELFYWHVRHHGIEGISSYMPVYKKNVYTEMRKNEFAQLCQRYTKLQKGQSAPDFMLVDIAGNRVSLADFKGKHVYIDVWASWCAPCCKEMPHLAMLERRFAGKPVAFVSVSIDEDEADWKRKVRELDLRGNQLYAGKTNFKGDYQITLVPRFVLLSPDGTIIDANMTRPSDPKTHNALLEILGD